ncbi:MAG TPA: methionine synthase [Pseudonocardia sp.]|nr:methionine synthase [Pseudonocardia sp.]
MSTDDALEAALAAAGLAGARPAQTAAGGAIVVPEAGDPPASPEPVRWPAGAATGVGSLPGTDAREAAATVTGEFQVLPHLAELPDRGVGADMIGRAAGLLVDLAVEVVPSGYRVTARPGHEHRRAVDLRKGDLDALDEACERTRPAWLKVQAAGPWTLAANVELHSGHRVLTDPGAVREFRASLVEGLRGHVAEVAARTGARVVVQLDEPSLPAVLAGALPTPSGYGTVAAVPAPEVQDALRDVVTALEVPVVLHCCAAAAPLRLLAGTGAAAVGIDATLPAFAAATARAATLDAIGEIWDAGTPLLLGLVPATEPGGDAPPPGARELAARAFELADRLGFARHRLAELAVPTPACGLAGASPQWARRAMALARELGEAFLDPDDR